MKFFWLVLGCMASSAAWASDPNQECAQSRERLRSAMMEDSQMIKNWGLAGMFTLVTKKVREMGALDGLSEALMEEMHRAGRPATAEEFKKELRGKENALKFYSALPELFDRYFVFTQILATGYDRSLDRVTCQANYYIDVDFLRSWMQQFEMEPDEAAKAEQALKTLNDIRRFSPTGRVSLRKTYIIQPDGNGATSLIFISNQ